MKNLVLNITAMGGWQTLGAGEGFPQRAYGVTMQARTAAAMQFRYSGQTNYYTIKANTEHTLPESEYWPGDIEVLAANGVVIEVEISTRVE